MHRRNFASISGVMIDVCRKHGVWLDHSELERILAFVREGGLDRARSARDSSACARSAGAAARPP